MPKDDCTLNGNRMIIGPDLGNGSRPCVRHLPDHSIQTGTIVPLKDGQSINGCDEVLSVRYDRDHGDFEVKSVYQPNHPSATKPSKGPAKVTSDEYRIGYDRIFGRHTVGEA